LFHKSGLLVPMTAQAIGNGRLRLGFSTICLPMSVDACAAGRVWGCLWSINILLMGVSIKIVSASVYMDVIFKLFCPIPMTSAS